MPKGRDSGISLSPDQLQVRLDRTQRALDSVLLEDDLSVLESSISLSRSPSPTTTSPPVLTSTMNSANAIAASLKASISLPQYSGRPRGSTFQGEKGQQVELYTVRGWIRRVDTVMAATGWTDKVAAQHAQLALLPNQPAGDWYMNQYEESYMDAWSTLKVELAKEFSPFINASDKVDILRSFSQAPNEMAGPYLNRIQLQYKRLIEDIELEFAGAPFDTETPAEKQRRQLTIKVLTDFHLASFFALGLHDSLLRDVTKANAKSLEEMLRVAKLSEQAQLQSKKRHTIAEVSTLDDISEIHDLEEEADNFDNMTDAECIAYVRRQGRGGRGGRGRGRGRGYSNTAGRIKSQLSCFFCFIPGHLANECQRRARERAEGKWRDSVQDPTLTKAEFDKRPRRRSFGQAAATEVGTVDADFSEESMYDEFYSSKN